MKLLLLLLLFAISSINTKANEKQDPQSFNQESLYYAGKTVMINLLNQISRINTKNWYCCFVIGML